MAELTAEDLAEYQADATPSRAEAENILSRITRLANELVQAQEDVTTQEAILKAAQERVRTLEEFQLPEAMDEAKQTALTTSDGLPVELTETIYASIPAANLPKAIMWLTSNNQGSIVKRQLTAKFGKEEDQKAAEALDLLLEAGVTPEDKQSVHPQTLAAMIREMLAEGKEVPMELLGGYTRRIVKIKKPKAPTKKKG